MQLRKKRMFSFQKILRSELECELTSEYERMVNQTRMRVRVENALALYSGCNALCTPTKDHTPKRQF